MSQPRRTAARAGPLIDVGQVLDKYELLEKVGSGGMAVVYRGLDRMLKREVAVKVLHHHLAEHEEARTRFAREAQAVAKLRHENILEIFDFSGSESAESYIVTEFIDGKTLKEFTAEHSIAYPEVGAMIVAQVCRALAHAHRLGVLHRDVKPENIMIRGDGVVKLTDFGIAQMLDTHRMTVTGQLLGSPAYMSPEHVEGGQLDFRTDVFATGILLYQLITGELPFKGKNPHEILKRIADCKFIEPRVVNSLVAAELNAIVVKAMAREKDGRYADVGRMLDALERYLTGCGLKEHREELARFFAAPVAYELALRERLIDALCRRGKARMADNRVEALDCFNRVLTIEPNHAETLAVIDRMSRRTRSARLAILAVAILTMGGAALAARQMWPQRERAAPRKPAGPATPAPPIERPAVGLPSPPPTVTPDAAPVARTAGAGAEAPARATPDAAPRGRTPREEGAEEPERPGRQHPAEPETRDVLVKVNPRNGTYRLDDDKTPHSFEGDFTLRLSTDRPHELTVSNDGFVEDSKVVAPTDSEVRFMLRPLPAQVTATCKAAGVSDMARINGKPCPLGTACTVEMKSSTHNKVDVVFTIGDRELSKSVTLVRGKETIVSCDEP